MNIPKLVIFDWDGTLVDSIDPILTGFRQAYQQQSHPCPPDDALRATIGLPLAAAFESLSPGLPAATMVTLYREYWFDPGRPASPWAAGALDTLAWLAAEGIKCAIATGKSRRGAEHELDLLDAQSHFLTLRSADDAPAKPDPSMLFQILEELGVPAEDTVMVGDSMLDLKMARTAQIAAYGVLGGVGSSAELLKEKPLRVLAGVGQLPQALSRREG